MVTAAGAQPGALLLRQDVQDDLKLSKEVRQKLQTAYSDTFREHGFEVEDQGQGRHSMRGGGNIKKAHEDFEGRAFKLITAAQKKRLFEIVYQIGSYSVIDREEVSKALKLTDTQLTKIKTLKSKAQQEQNELVSGSGGRIDSGLIEDIKKIQQRLTTELSKVLTQAQDAEFKQLQGKPFKGSKS
ncbi:MAG: hypothetical protein KF784_09870 [Fimbriimonadaceae bacterium]|nr:hypothetical protein [Fimbriimonadaceae bacterium]